MTRIFHITKRETWNKAKEQNKYNFCALETEGFIHCSTIDQCVPTANRFFKGHRDLIVLELDEKKIEPEVKYEIADVGDEKFPHIYGELNLDAVVGIRELTLGDNDEFLELKEL